MNEYSEKEMMLIEYFGFSDNVEYVDPPKLYLFMAEEAFLSNDQSNYAESLRRCCKAINKCHPYRMTKEFDDLINI